MGFHLVNSRTPENEVQALLKIGPSPVYVHKLALPLGRGV